MKCKHCEGTRREMEGLKIGMEQTSLYAIRMMLGAIGIVMAAMVYLGENSDG